MNYLKKNIKLAYKSVVFHFKSYMCFYAALFIIQFLFGLIVMTTVNTNQMREEEITEKYDYHLCLSGLNQAQHDYLKDKQYGTDQRTKNKLMLRKTEKRYVDEFLRYDMYYVYENEFEDSPESIHEWFTENAINTIKGKQYKNANFEVILSPLYNMGSIAGAQIGECVLLLAILFIVGFTVVLLLYNIRINHFKFTYGIYMSYGADFRKLFETSFWEMFVIQLLTLLPATVLSTLVNWSFYFFSGYSYSFSPYMMLLALPFTSLVAFLAVYIPIKRAAVKPPLELLLAEDNSNLASSPRVSFNMSGRRFPSSYSLFSAIRFRKYNLQVVCSAVIFSALFICAIFGSTIYSHVEESIAPEYKVVFNQHTEKVIEETLVKKDVTEEYKKALKNNDEEKLFEYELGLDTELYVIEKADGTPGNLSDVVMSNGKIFEWVVEESESTRLVGVTYTSAMGNSLLAIPGVTGVYKECVSDANELSTFLYMDPDKVNGDDDMLIYDQGYGLRAYTQDANYYALDAELLNYLKANYEISGDTSKMLRKLNKPSDTHYVIVTNSRNNEDTLSLEPGDYIVLESFNNEIKITSDDPMTGKQLMQYIVDNAELDIERSIRFEVCAVIENMSTSENYPLFITETAYEMVTGKAPQYKELLIYTEDMDDDQLAKLTLEVRRWAKKYEDTTVTPLNALEEKRAQEAECKLPMLIAASVTLLMIAPIFWFFSQILFYRKRDKEIELLRAMGAIESEIRGMFVRDGLIYAGLGALFTAILGGVGVTVIYNISQKVFAFTGEYFTTRFELRFPWIALGAGMLIAAACAFFSSYIPYLIDRKQTQKRMTVSKDIIED